MFSKCLLFSVLTYFVNSQEIYLFDLSVKKDAYTLSTGKNITKHKGYDSQPFFHPDLPLIYYTSEVISADTDIKFYNFETGKTNTFEGSKASVYSPIVTPDKQFISCIYSLNDQGIVQNLVKFPIASGKPITLINNLTIGYHSWFDNSNVLLFVLQDSVHVDLHYFNTDSKKDTILASSIGRTIKNIPNQDAMTFIDKSNPDLWIIKRLDIKSKTISNLTQALKGNEDFTVLENGTVIMSDGNKLYSYNAQTQNNWQEINIKGEKGFLKDITRIAVNLSQSKIAIVVGE